MSLAFASKIAWENEVNILGFLIYPFIFIPAPSPLYHVVLLLFRFDYFFFYKKFSHLPRCFTSPLLFNPLPVILLTTVATMFSHLIIDSVNMANVEC